MMTPAELSHLHNLCFETPRPYSAAQFTSLLPSRGMSLFTRPEAFLLARIIAGEAEIITLAVHPDHRREGLAQQLMNDFLTAAKSQSASSAFLEVAADNSSAQALYEKHGFLETHRRPRYYRTPSGKRVDAIVMMRDL